MNLEWADDDRVTFSAMGLFNPGEANMWRLSYVVNQVVEELAPDTPMNNHDWREHVVIPFFRDVLVPDLPYTMDVTYAVAGLSDSPLALRSVDGKPWAGEQDPRYHDLSSALSEPEYRVDLPATFLADVLLGAQSMQSLAGVPLHLIESAFAAGLRPEEIRAHQAAGTLTAESLAVMAALKA